jgi:hypothetical protein
MAWERLDETICPAFADQHLALLQGPDALLQEKRIAGRALDQQALQRGQTGIIA